jgi:ribonucleoside-triphosphate reductase
MLTIRKRDGETQEFKLVKIENAIERAFVAEHKYYNKDIIEMLALRVVSNFNEKVRNNCIDVEDIQDSVEVVLIQSGFVDVAKSYILYRKKHQDDRQKQLTGTELDYKLVVDNYLKIADWRVKENSTVTYSVGGLILSNSGAITANYWLSEIYDK